MAVKYTEEQLNNVDKSLLIAMLINQQEQMESLKQELLASNEKMQKLMEQLILSNQERFGRSSEKMEDTNQICFMEVDGNIVFFNETEAVCDLTAEEPEDLMEPNITNSLTITYNEGNGEMNGSLRILLTLTLIAIAPILLIMLTLIL